MTIDEKLELILEELSKNRQDMDGMRQDMDGMRQDMDGMRQDMDGMRQDMDGMRQDMNEMRQDIAGINLHLEQITDRNISILAENHIELINKLNKSVGIADKNTIYEIRVNLLTEKVEKLEKELADIKNRIA